MSKTNDAENRTLTIEKTFNAPLELVWEAWTKPEHIAQWWGQKGMEVKIIEHDFKEGGEWKYTMAMPDGGEFVSEGKYSEIVEEEKIVTSADFRPMTEDVEMVMLFEADGDQTKFTFSVIHPTEEYKIQQEKMGFYNGWGSIMDQLGNHIDEMK